MPSIVIVGAALERRVSRGACRMEGPITVECWARAVGFLFLGLT